MIGGELKRGRHLLVTVGRYAVVAAVACILLILLYQTRHLYQQYVRLEKIKSNNFEVRFRSGLFFGHFQKLKAMKTQPLKKFKAIFLPKKPSIWGLHSAPTKISNVVKKLKTCPKNSSNAPKKLKDFEKTQCFGGHWPLLLASLKLPKNKPG